MISCFLSYTLKILLVLFTILFSFHFSSSSKFIYESQFDVYLNRYILAQIEHIYFYYFVSIKILFYSKMSEKFRSNSFFFVWSATIKYQQQQKYVYELNSIINILLWVFAFHVWKKKKSNFQIKFDINEVYDKHSRMAMICSYNDRHFPHTNAWNAFLFTGLFMYTFILNNIFHRSWQTQIYSELKQTNKQTK